MRMLALLVALFLISSVALAHPGIGIVIDSRGNVFYTDLHHVWRVGPDGRKTIAVANVHTHELVIDAQDNLYGEHLWYEGETIDKWGHYVWRRSPDGRVMKVIPPTEGFLTNYSFIRDRNGTMYWADREHSEIKKRSGSGPVTTLARGRFRDVRWMNVTPDGVVYFVDTRDLMRILPDGSMRTVARDLAPASLLAGRHVLFGIWFDRAGNVYVADHAHRNVRRVTADGRASVVVESSFPWAPTGGVFAPNGDLWLLEYSVTNQARVRRVTRH